MYPQHQQHLTLGAHPRILLERDPPVAVNVVEGELPVRLELSQDVQHFLVLLVVKVAVVVPVVRREAKPEDSDRPL